MAKAYNMEVNVLIAGAGPAGTSLSMFLSAKKIPHLIIDKSVFPRDKVCGDALSGKVVDVLNKLDKNFSSELNSDQQSYIGSYGVKFAAPNGKFIDIPFKKDLSTLTSAPGFISKRIHFDNYLFQKIDRKYATVMENCSIRALERKDGGVECLLMTNGNDLTTGPVSEGAGSKAVKIFTKVIVGAEGDRSIVAKKFSDVKKEDEHYCAGLRAYYKGVINFHEKNFIELHFLKELLPGYLWIFPLPNGEANVGVGMLSSEVSKRKINLKKVMLEAIANNPTIRNRFANATLDGEIRGWGLPLGSKKRKISGDNFLLLGDAASLIDPFTGEGIGNAMVSGMIAAKHIASAIERNQFDEKFFSAYDDEIYKSLWDELKLSHTLQKLSKYSWLFNYVVSKAERNETLRDTITCMFDDLQMRDRLRSPKFYLGLVFGK